MELEHSNQPEAAAKTNNSKVWLIASTTALLTAVIVGAGMYMWQQQLIKKVQIEMEAENENLKQQINSLEEQDQLTPASEPVPLAASHTPSVTNLPASTTQDWKTYTHPTYGYQIQYPPDWTPNSAPGSSLLGFYTPEVKSDYTWGIHAWDKKETTKERVIQTIGSQFGSNRGEARKEITINGVPATHVTITTSTIPNWYAEHVLVEDENYIYDIGNGAIKNELFDKFYDSFTLAN